MDYVGLLGAALAGTVLSSLLACLPALHIYNVAGLLILLAPRLEGLLPGDMLALFMLGLVIGYAVVNTIPSIFFGAPDESTLFVVLPGQRYLMQQRGFEASVLTGVGGLGGLLVLLLLAPVMPRLFPVVRVVVGPHLHWILGAIIVFMLMSEWPKGSDRGRTGLAKFLDAWSSLGAGLLTFLLSGLLGMVLLYSNLVPAERAFQNLLPAFVGLFAVPWVLQNLLSQAQVPAQHAAGSVDLTPGLIARGVGAGALGGLFAAFFPVVTGGIGGFLAGHATAQRDDRLFILSQGASKLIYYVGGFLLFFVPGLHLTRGGMAGMLSILYTPHTPATFWLVIAATLICGALAFGLLLGLSRVALRLVTRLDYRWVSAGTLGLLVGVVFAMTGWGGLLISVVATAIGLLPVMWGARRMNCMGVLLLPLTLQMAGLGTTVAGWLGLI
ncbi:MAG: tripartite tricarboxylate transporter permease [Anaerolineae bacterium]|jgi:putative membrane protein